ncbi:hypothetical protein H1C71_040692 [Ictidomys tridecemlineatus]|nr:hypothetical protein H1C71_040692 [Ictidomys tridecemlineatus]KAG3294363.1 hypothetical protein H1C71_040692 [Ictidomys tridecemlineatus]
MLPDHSHGTTWMASQFSVALSSLTTSEQEAYVSLFWWTRSSPAALPIASAVPLARRLCLGSFGWRDCLGIRLHLEKRHLGTMHIVPLGVGFVPVAMRSCIIQELTSFFSTMRPAHWFH